MDLETYSRSKFADYAALAEIVAAILRAAISSYPTSLRLQQVQHRSKDPASLKKKLEDRGLLATNSLENDIKDLAGCRLIFYTNSDVSRFLQSSIIQDNFDVDWDRTKIHHPVPGQTEPDNLFVSNNYVLRLKAVRAALPEYARFDGLWCEVQVQTTLNHAWSEMAHDIIYKKPALAGFGAKLFDAIDQRLQKIMKTHLLPAGYEFQKVLDDYERLRNGKELVDRGALKALPGCSDNNARYDLLERFRDYVLPNYDDPQSVYPEITEQLVAAVVAARLTKTRPRETPFGNFPGVEIGQFVDVVCDILALYRYVNIELTFGTLCELFVNAADLDERKHLLTATEQLARNDLGVWEQAGPYVQVILVDAIDRLDRSQWEPIRPVLVEVLGEALKNEIQGVSSTYRTFTFSRGTTPPSDALTRMRSKAIELLKELYTTGKADSEKRQVKSAILEATRRPMNGTTSNALLQTILENGRAIVDFFAELAPGESFEMLQTLERSLLWMYRHNRGTAGAVEPEAAVLAARDALNSSILKFRDVANANKGFVVYKTLVGYESVFPPAWEGSSFDIKGQEQYRKDRIDELVKDVNDQNAEEWLSILKRCAATESNDLATFPSLGEFLQKLSQAKPLIVLGFVDRLGERLTGFLGVMLSGLARSGQRAALDRRMAEWLAQEMHLVEMAHYIQFAPEFDGELLRKILIAGIRRDDDAVVVQVMASYARRFADAEEGTITTIFMEAIRFFAARKDARWVNLVWFIPKERSPLRTLDAGQVDPILESLMHLPSIETHGEWVLASLAEKYPEKVFDFFGARMQYREAREEGERYEDIPHEFECLQKSLVPIAEYAVATARKWFVSGDSMFQFRGGRLLAIGFPDFAEPFRRSLFALTQTGQRADVEFVLRVLTNYHGQVFLHELCKAIVKSLPADDPFLTDVEIILESTDVLTGEFGRVHALTAKKQEVADWLTDPDERVSAFAKRYTLLLDRQISAEQRRAEENIEMRKRTYGEPDGKDAS